MSVLTCKNDANNTEAQFLDGVITLLTRDSLDNSFSEVESVSENSREAQSDR